MSAVMREVGRQEWEMVGRGVADALNFSWVSIFCIKENAFLGSPQIFRL